MELYNLGQKQGFETFQGWSCYCFIQPLGMSGYWFISELVGEPD
jgi:hypothetical protein